MIHLVQNYIIVWLTLSLSPVHQVGGEDEGVREQAIDYVSSSLMSMRHILFIPHPENEKQLVRHVKKVSWLLRINGWYYTMGNTCGRELLQVIQNNVKKLWWGDFIQRTYLHTYIHTHNMWTDSKQTIETFFFPNFLSFIVCLWLPTLGVVRCDRRGIWGIHGNAVKTTVPCHWLACASSHMTFNTVSCDPHSMSCDCQRREHRRWWTS